MMNVSKVIILFALMFLFLMGSAKAMDLTEAYDSALQKNPNFLSQKYDFEASKTYKMQGLSYLLPQVYFSANRTPYYFNDAPYYYTNYTGETYQLTAQQYLFNLSSFATYQEFNTRAKMGEYKFKDANGQLMYDVSNAYFDLLEKLDQLNLNEKQQAAAKSDLELSQSLFDAGEVTLVDVNNARSRYAVASANLTDAKNKYEVSASKFKLLVGREPDTLCLLRDDAEFSLPSPDSLEGWIALAEKNSPVIKYYEQSLNYYKQDLTKNIGSQLPTVALTASYVSTNTNSYQQTSKIKYDTIGVQVNVPIFDGGNSIAKINESHYRVKQAKEDEKNYKSKVIEAITESFLNIKSDISKIESLRVAVRSDQESLKASYMGVKAGSKSMNDILNAEEQLYGDQDQLIRVKYDYLDNFLQLKLNAGLLSKDDLKSINSNLDSNAEKIKNL